ncbi:HDOD domain-containing protein [Ideonella sp.]|uniref:HDOD domain-containing protein n=1 Tax=Ideonella sp. TaxID=1929293 RepID=UPI002B495A7D|nr:HDOD domain-containing protein [Ideonella sp.]HJV69821.1 HDOD domain-containing protein [Ideonella sp.]
MNAPDTPLFPPRRTPMDVVGWVRYFQLAEIPVQAPTAAAIEDLRANEDAVDARMLAEIIAADPLMTLKLLAYTAALPRHRHATDVETAQQALVLIGITPFFRDFGPQPTIEAHLQGQPEALEGLREVIRRAHRAAKFALGFAVHRFDHDAPVIHEATLLHDFAEMLLWLHAPHLALDITYRQKADPTLRSSVAQRALLGVPLADIQHALMLAWRLPELLVRITDDRQESASQVRNVMLAIRLARHTARSWDNAALPDDVRDIAQLLNMGVAPTEALLHELDS